MIITIILFRSYTRIFVYLLNRPNLQGELHRLNFLKELIKSFYGEGPICGEGVTQGCTQEFF